MCLANREMAVSIDIFDELEQDVEEFTETEAVIPEASPATRLSRRRKIEDLFEEKRLRLELDEYLF